MNFKAKTVLITGASAGLGKDFARLFAAEGANVILTARRADRLESLAVAIRVDHGVETRVIPADLSEPGAAKSLVEAATADGADIDVLVNNAGFGSMGPFADMPYESQSGMVQVNVTALVELTHLVLPGMIRRGEGGILNIASTASFQPGPFMATYFATKAFVREFSEGLAEEVRRQGIHVSCLCPGPTATEFGDTEHMQLSAARQLSFMASEPVARAGIEGLRRNRTVVIPGALNKLGRFGAWLVPNALIRKIIAGAQRKAGRW